MKFYEIQVNLVNFMKMSGIHGNWPPQRRHTSNLALCFLLFRATWGIWTILESTAKQKHDFCIKHENP